MSDTQKPSEPAPEPLTGLTDEQAVEALLKLDASDDPVTDATGKPVPDATPEPQPSPEPPQGQQKDSSASDPDGLSVEELALLGQDPSAGDPSTQTEPGSDPNAEPSHTFVIDGETVTVTRSELEKGYGREQVWTKKMQKLAEDRRSMEAQSQQVMEQRQRYIDELQRIEDASKVETPDWDRIQREQPDQYPAMWAQWQQRQESLRAIKERKEAEQAQQQRDLEAQAQAAARQEVERLAEVYPVFKEPSSVEAQQAYGRIVEYGVRQGFDKTEVESVVDHRVLVMIDKARKFDVLMSRKKALRSKVDAAPSVGPGSRSTQRQQQRGLDSRALERLGKSGSIEDATAALMDIADI